MRQFAAAIVASTVTANRTMSFRNLCNEPVWFGFAGGSTDNTHHSGTMCNSDNDCFQGTKCVTTGDIRQCFFNNPTPDGNNFKLNHGDQRDVQIPIFDNDFIWSGAITGKTGCDNSGSNCATADCGNDGNGSCFASRGFM